MITNLASDYNFRTSNSSTWRQDIDATKRFSNKAKITLRSEKERRTHKYTKTSRSVVPTADGRSAYYRVPLSREKVKNVAAQL